MSLEDRVAALEARLRAAEDELEILRLLNAYGPLVDSNEARAAAQLWLEGGVHDIDGVARFTGADEIASIYTSAGHTELTGRGCAHIVAAPQVKVNGDTAEAFAYVFVIEKDADRWTFWRASVNTFDLVRTPAGWRMERKYNHPVDGSEKSHETMRRVIALREA